MRAWDMFEQACLLKELYERFQLTQTQIARFLGKDKSWVSRRLSFLNTLPGGIVAAVRSGHISSWSAHRVLTPLARANAEHARKLAHNLKKEPLSIRNLALFFDHYKKANRRARENMVHHPHLFLRALENCQSKKQAKILKAGPEGRWIKEISTVERILARLIGQVPTVFTSVKVTVNIYWRLLRKPSMKCVDWGKLSVITNEKKKTILTLHQSGCEIRRISRLFKVSRNTVRRVLQKSGFREQWNGKPC